MPTSRQIRVIGAVLPVAAVSLLCIALLSEHLSAIDFARQANQNTQVELLDSHNSDVAHDPGLKKIHKPWWSGVTFALHDPQTTLAASKAASERADELQRRRKVHTWWGNGVTIVLDDPRATADASNTGVSPDNADSSGTSAEVLRRSKRNGKSWWGTEEAGSATLASTVQQRVLNLVRSQAAWLSTEEEEEAQVQRGEQHLEEHEQAQSEREQESEQASAPELNRQSAQGSSSIGDRQKEASPTVSAASPRVQRQQRATSDSVPVGLDSSYPIPVEHIDAGADGAATRWTSPSHSARAGY